MSVSYSRDPRLPIHAATEEDAIDAMLGRIQNDLFDLGADLAVPDTGSKPGHERLAIVPAQTARLESEIDGLNARLQPLKSFILPGGSPAAAALHLARTVARRAERVIVELAQDPAERVNPEAVRYVNRVSDFCSSPARGQ